VVFTFDPSAQSWTVRQAQSPGPGFDARYDGSFGKDRPGSLAAAIDSASAAGASGAVSWRGPWTQLKVPAGRSVVAVSAGFDCYVGSLSGAGAGGVRQRLDLAGSSGSPVAGLVPEGRCQGSRTWATVGGPSALVPAEVASASATIELVLSGATDWSGTAEWHWDNVKLTIWYR
jgi:hypothetical protein